MPDIFGSTKSQSTGGVLNANHVFIAVEGSSQTSFLQLAQSVRLTYGRQVQPVTAMGTDSVWMCPQTPTGNLEVTRAVGKGTGTLLSPYKPSDACATTTLTIGKAQEVACADVDPGMVQASPAMLESVSINIQVGQGIGVTDGARWQLGGVSI